MRKIAREWGREIQQGIGDAEIDVDADTTKAKKEIRDVEKGHYKAEVKVDVDQASLAKTRRVIASAGGGGGGVGSALGNLGKGEALTLALGIGPNVVPLIGSAGQAVAQLSGVLGLSPPRRATWSP